jgi:WD domain, G-beta repeat
MYASMGDIHLNARVSGEGHATLAGRDVHFHYQGAGPQARRVISADASDIECPYPGLASFKAEQSRWFFGRGTLIAELTGRLAERLESGGPLIVVGPSGAGKSSLLRAGLLPAIERGALPRAGSAQWPRVLLTPGAHPMTELSRQLESHGRQSRVIIVVDQLEELFALCPDERERREFIDTLDAMADSDNGALVLYGLRADAYHHCLRYPALSKVLPSGQVIVGPMSLPELRQVIEFPARDVALELEPGLVDLMLSDLGVTDDCYEAGRLPLLAYALQATWRQRHGHLLTVVGYQTAGGIHHAVATAAERVYSGLDETCQQAVKAVFLRLVRIGNGADDTRRTIARDDLVHDSSAAVVVDDFTNARLLTCEHATVTITHEALLRAWPRLAGWIRDDHAGNLRRQELEDAAIDWERAGREPALLLRGGRLESAVQAASQLSPAAGRLRIASVKERARGQRRRRALALVVAMLTAVATVTAGIAFTQAATARAVLRQVTIDDLIAQAVQLRDADGDPGLAAQFDLAAYRLWRGSDLATQNPALYDGMITAASQQLPSAEVNQAVFAPNGHVLAVAGGGGIAAIQLWDVTGVGHPALLSTLDEGSDLVSSLAISPNGSLLVAGFLDGTVRLWNISNPRSPVARPLIADPAPCYGVNCSYDVVRFAGFTSADTLVVTRANDGTTLYDTAGTAAARPVSLPRPGELGYVLATDPADHMLVAGGEVATTPARVWNASDPARPRLLRAPIIRYSAADDDPYSATFVLADHRLAAFPATPSGGIELLSIPDGARIGRVTTVNNALSATHMAYEQSGDTLAVIDDGQLRFWNVTDPQSPVQIGQPLLLPGGGFGNVALSPDASLAFTVPGDDSLPGRLLDLNVTTAARDICATDRALPSALWQRYVPGLRYEPSC